MNVEKNIIAEGQAELEQLQQETVGSTENINNVAPEQQLPAEKTQPEIPTVQIVTPAVTAVCVALVGEQGINDAGIKQGIGYASDAYAQLLDKYFPDGFINSVEGNAAIASYMLYQAIKDYKIKQVQNDGEN